ncbi:MAG: hypothetical protein AAF629_25800 [Chloroflexota bacterium]
MVKLILCQPIMKYGNRLFWFILAMLTLSLFPSASLAHPADQYFQKHNIYLTPEHLRIEWSINPGPLLASWVWNEADTNLDRVISEAESQAWVSARIEDFTLVVDDTPLTWQVESIVWPESVDLFQGGDSPILLHLQADWTSRHEQPRLHLNNRVEEEASIMWYYVYGEAGVTFQKPTQQGGELVIDVALAKPNEGAQNTGAWQTYWDTGTPTLPAGTNATELPEIAKDIIPDLAEDTRPFALLTELVRSPQISLNFILIALGVSAFLGALHALTPGHGKTVVAAYLVGARGTTKHAIILGSIVTLTHTGSVFALGLLTLAISQYILPTRLFPILELVSGLLIVGLGAYLLYQRWLAWQSGKAHHHHHHHHHHDHSHDDGHHHHHHDDHEHHHHHHIPDPSELTWRSLITLGVSGGIVPCPDAIAILLVAMAINRIALGLSLIVAFSLGLALVLIVIGLVMVHSRRLFEKMDSFGRLAPALPVVSAVVVLLLGVGLTVSAIRGTGAFHIGGAEAEIAAIPIGSTTEDEAEVGQNIEPFDVKQNRILYMGRNEDNRNQLYLIGPEDDRSQPITQEPAGITDFALSPDGQTVAFTVLRQEGGADLFAINLNGSNRRQLVECEGAACSQGIWAPNGQRLVYQRLVLEANEANRNANALWWLDPVTSDTGPVFQNVDLSGYSPSWSPDGDWLSYISPGNIGLQLYNLQNGTRFTIPNRAGSPVAWSPDSTAILVSDVLEINGTFVTHLFRFDLETESLTNLSGANAQVVDSNAVWSPDGAWISFVRRTLDDPTSSTGNQLWLMRPEGSEAHPLTNHIDVAYGTPTWSPDSAHLVFHRHPLKVAKVQPAIFILNIETGSEQTIKAEGNRPVWVQGPDIVASTSP